MLINLDNIKLEEYDLYTQDTETILNKKFMEKAYYRDWETDRKSVV